MLLVVATGIWGVIVVRLINLTDAPRLTSVEPIRHEDEMSGLKDTLLLNYRDPFLGSIPVKVISRGKKREPRVLVSPMEELAPSFILLGKIRKGEKDFLLVESGGENRLITPTDRKSIQIQSLFVKVRISTRSREIEHSWDSLVGII